MKMLNRSAVYLLAILTFATVSLPVASHALSRPSRAETETSSEAAPLGGVNHAGFRARSSLG